jgi:hypothetical protein
MQQSVLSLNNMLETFFNPARESWEKSQRQSKEEHSFAALAFVEAYGWIRVGVQANAFPRANALDFLATSGSELLKALEIVEPLQLIGESAIALTRQSIKRKSFPHSFAERYPDEFSALPEVATTFILWCAECCSFAQSTHASAFVRRLCSPYRANWPPVLQQLQNEYFDVAGVDVISLFEGYLLSLQHLNRIADLFSVSGIDPQKRPAVAVMRVEAASIHRWRLNLSDRFYQDRFSEATQIVETRLRQEAGAPDIDIKLEQGGFIAGVESIVRRYIQSLGYLSSSGVAT